MANRPVVLVYQEYSTLSFATATPELPACIVGPAYQIVDYPEDRVKGSPVLTYGVENAGVDAPVGPFTLTLASALKAGAALDLRSVRLFVENGRGRVDRFLNMTTVAAGTTIDVGAGPGNVRVGDYCVLTSGTNVLVRRVRQVAADGVITFTSQFPADSASWTNGATVTAQFERPVVDAEIPVGKVTVTAVDNIQLAALTMKDVAGTDLPLVSGMVYAAFRALRTDLARFTTVSSFGLSKSNELGNLGKLDPRNPLCVGVHVAAKNTNTPVIAYGISSDTPAGYTEARLALSSRPDAYAVAVLATDYAVVKEFGDSFVQSANPDYVVANGISQRFRVALGYAGALPMTKLLAQRATASAAAAGVLTHNTARFVDSGVIVGDRVRFYGAQGTVTAEREITAVTSNESLSYANTGGETGVTTSYDVVRDISRDKDAQVLALVARAASCGNRRTILCWPDLVEVTGLVDGSKPRLANGAMAPADFQPGAYLACALTGMTAALPSHQGLTNFSPNGIKSVLNASPYFNDQQITQLSNGGLFVFTQDDESALPYVVHELTTDPSTLEFGEFMCVKNMDYVSIALKSVLDGFLGKWNLTDETLGFVGTAVQQQIETLMLDKRPRIGARLRSATVASLAESAASADRAEIFIEAKFPKPLNTIGLHLVSG